jgi:hypothetical protein
MKYTRESFIRALGVSVMPDEFGMHFEETMAEYDELGAPYLSDEFLENIQNEFDLFEVKYDFVKKEIARVRESDLLCRYSMLMKRMMVDKDEMALITLPEVPRGSTEEETVDLEMAAFFAQLAFLPDMPERTALWVSSPAMAQAVSELEAEDTTFEGLPEACRAVTLKAASLAALCGPSALERLSRALGAEQLERPLCLLLPQ